MDNKNIWKRIAFESGIMFAAFALVLFIIKILMSDGIYQSTFSVYRMLLILAFFVLLAIANRILDIEKLNGWWKLLCHAALTFAGFFILIYAPMTGEGKYLDAKYEKPNIIVVIALVLVIYAVCYGVYFAISSRGNKKQNAKSDYKPLYKGKDEPKAEPGKEAKKDNKKVNKKDSKEYNSVFKS